MPAYRNILVVEKTARYHRARYLDNIARVLGGEKSLLCEARFWKLMRCDLLVCSTCDDYFIRFFLLSLFRWFSGAGRLRTIGISIRSEYCFSGGAAKYYIKRSMLRALKNLKLAEVYSTNIALSREIVEKNLAGVVVDPIIYCSLKHKRMLGTNTYNVVYLGGINKSRGVFNFFEYLEKNEINTEIYVGRYLLAGRLEIGAQTAELQRFIRRGGELVVGYLEEETYTKMLEAADLVWAMQESDYDQSSGVFFEGLVLGKKVAARKGAAIENMSLKLGAAVNSEFKLSNSTGVIVQLTDLEHMKRELKKSLEVLSHAHKCPQPR